MFSFEAGIVDNDAENYIRERNENSRVKMPEPYFRRIFYNSNSAVVFGGLILRHDLFLRKDEEDLNSIILASQ